MLRNHLIILLLNLELLLEGIFDANTPPKKKTRISVLFNDYEFHNIRYYQTTSQYRVINTRKSRVCLRYETLYECGGLI